MYLHLSAKCDPTNELSISAVSDVESSLAMDNMTIEAAINMNGDQERLLELEQKCAQFEETVGQQKLEMFDLIENVSKSMKAAFEDSESLAVDNERRVQWMFNNLHERRKVGKFHSTVESLRYDGSKPTRRIRKQQQ